MPRHRGRNLREINQEQPSATIPLIPIKKSKPMWAYCSWDFILILCVVFTAAAYMFLYIYLNPSLEKLPPVQAPEFDNKQWGSYRAQTYFGLRTRSPNSPLFGMMWYEQPEAIFRPTIRHWCNQADALPHYAWYEADGRTFGKQNLTDLNGKISTDWINDGNGGFSARVKFNMKPGKKINVILYLASLDNSNRFKLGGHLKEIFHGTSELLGDFNLSVNLKNVGMLTYGHSNILKDEQVPIERLHDYFVDNMQVFDESPKQLFYTLNGKNDNEGRLVAVQMNFGNVADFDISFTTGNQKPVIGEDFDKEIMRRSHNFNKKYENVFGIAKKNYTTIEQKMGKIALSNMLGGVGYWNGYNKVQVGGYLQIYGPHTLFSAIPSRPFFPRGFLWDEGFHQMLIRKFDPKMSLELGMLWEGLKV